MYESTATVSGELWKRAFWCLVYLDRVSSITLGRSPALHDEEWALLPYQAKRIGLLTLFAFSFDVDFPIDCDDEYWIPSDGGVPFKQPPRIPSKITFFNLSNKLNQITSLVLRTIVSSQYAARIQLTRFKVFYQPVKGVAGLRWTPVATGHRRTTGLGAE